MIYTSGTTGKPKGALRPNVVDPSQVAAMIGLIGYTPDDVYLPTVRCTTPDRASGRRPGARPDGRVAASVRPGGLLRLVQTHRVSSTFAAPTPIRMICNLPAEVKAKYDTSSMKRMIANAAPWASRSSRCTLPTSRPIRSGRCTARPSSA